MNNNLSTLFTVCVLTASMIASCTFAGETEPAKPNGESSQEEGIEENEVLSPDFIAMTDDSALFVLGIKRIGGFSDQGRNTHIEISAQVPIRTISGKDWTFSGTGYGMLEETGDIGPNHYNTLREMKYEVKGSFMDCDLFLDEVMEIWGVGEICTTVPLAGTQCETIPEGETDYLLLDTEVIIFDAYREEGGYWWIISEWERGGLHWKDSFSLEEYAPAVEMKVFEFMGCKFEE